MSVETHHHSARRLLRIAFVLYALALVTGTHWPKLVIYVPSFSFADKVLHFTAFLLWTILLALTGWVRAKKGPAMQMLVIGLIAAGYATADELTQGIPAVMRTVSMGDLAANLLGIVVGVSALAIMGRRMGGPAQ